MGNSDNHVVLVDEKDQWYGVKQVDGKPRVSSIPYLYDVGEGNIADHELFDKYAVNDDVDSANEEDIWCVGGVYSWLASETQLVAVSSSVEDDPDKGGSVAGTGIWSVRVYYLDDDFVSRTVDVTLNGTTEVALSVANVYRINKIRPLTMGTGLKAAGNIDIKLPAPGSTIYSRIAAGFTKGRQLVYTVPAGRVFYLNYFIGSIGGTTAPKYGKFVLRSTYDSVSGNQNAWMTAYIERGASSGNTGDPHLPGPLKFPEGSDIVMSCKTLDDNCYVTGAIRGWLENA